MKTRLAHKTLIALGFATLPFITGCTQQSAANSPTYATSSIAPASATSPGQPAPIIAEVSPQVTPTPIEVNAAEAAPVVLPEKLRISQSLHEVIRLAQAGVDEGVILTYVTNSSAMFTLGAEEIVYLHDLGISDNVITAMMQRDQSLKASAAANSEQIAAAPTYVNPPQPVVVQESQPIYVTENYFNDSLSPYGTWVEVDGYGRCWRPTVAITSPTWRPYCDRGRWVYTDAGWYWMSDYSWGSVAFHYGRWFSHPRMGWCWWPDTVWGPSWVSWRYNNNNCGWAPLPPLSYYRPGIGFSYYDRAVGVSFDFGLSVNAFTFVSWGRFCDPHPYRHYIPRHQVNTVYNQTTIINNYGDGNNNTVINRGISTDRVREHSRAEVRTVSIRDERPRKGEVRNERLEGGGRTLVVPRPILSPLPPLPGIGKIGSPFEKSSARVYSTTPDASATLQPASTTSRESKSGRERTGTTPGTINQPVAVAPNAKVIAPSTPQPDSSRDGRSGREQRIESKSSERNRSVQPVIASPAVVSTPATPTRTATPIFSKPLVVETVPHNPSRPVVAPPQHSTTVIGDGRNRSGNRDYSVWNTPKQQPTPTQQPAPFASAPSYYRAPSRNQNVSENSPQVEAVQQSRPFPSENRPSNYSRREEKVDRPNASGDQSRNRSEARSSAPVISTPAPAPRQSAPAYTPSLAPVSRPSAPAYAPPPAPRVESQPAPARSESARSESRSNSRPESKSDSNQNKRDR